MTDDDGTFWVPDFIRHTHDVRASHADELHLSEAAALELDRLTRCWACAFEADCEGELGRCP